MREAKRTSPCFFKRWRKKAGKKHNNGERMENASR
jgi:hypothetical protein